MQCPMEQITFFFSEENNIYRMFNFLSDAVNFGFFWQKKKVKSGSLERIKVANSNREKSAYFQNSAQNSQPIFQLFDTF